MWLISNKGKTTKWLGQIISSAGLSDSVAKTVKDEEGKIRGACLEIGIIINDLRAQDLGGMETALMLWGTCCVPSFLHGAGTWLEINKPTVQFNSVWVPLLSFTGWTRVAMFCTFVGQPDARYGLKNLDTEGSASITHQKSG